MVKFFIMGQATPFAIRQNIVELRKSGKTHQQISDELQIPFSTVNAIWGQYQHQVQIFTKPSLDCKSVSLSYCALGRARNSLRVMSVKIHIFTKKAKLIQLIHENIWFFYRYSTKNEVLKWGVN